jgi:hypothetical protein
VALEYVIPSLYIFDLFDNKGPGTGDLYSAIQLINIKGQRGHYSSLNCPDRDPMTTNRYKVVIRAPEKNPYKWANMFPPSKNARWYARAITTSSTRENAVSMVFLLLRFVMEETSAKTISMPFRLAAIIELLDPSSINPDCSIRIIYRIEANTPEMMGIMQKASLNPVQTWKP